MKDKFVSLSFPNEGEQKSPALTWLGWDNIYSSDTGEMKKLMQKIFFKSFSGDYKINI